MFRNGQNNQSLFFIFAFIDENAVYFRHQHRPRKLNILKRFSQNRALGIARHAPATRRAPPTPHEHSSRFSAPRASSLTAKLVLELTERRQQQLVPTERQREREGDRSQHLRKGREGTLSDHGSAESRDHLSPGGCDECGYR